MGSYQVFDLHDHWSPLTTFLLSLKVSTLTYTITGRQLTMNPCRWLSIGGGTFDKGRVVAYTKAKDVVRFPLVKMQNTPVQYRGLDQSTIYYAALGQVEFVRPEMVYYGDMTSD